MINCLKREDIYNKIGEFGLYIYILSLMFSKAGINIGLVFMFFGVFFKIWKKEKISFLKEEKFILLILILTPLFSLLSPGGIDSFKIAFQKNYRYLSIFFIPLFLTNEKILKKAFFFILFSFSINFFRALTLFWKNGFNFPYTRYVSFGGNTLNDSHMNAMVIFLFFVFFVHSFKNRDIRNKILSVVFFLLILIALLLGQGRGAWLGSIFGFIVLSFLMIKSKKKYMFGLFVIIMLCCGSLKFSVVRNHYLVKRFLSIKETKNNTSNKIRLLMWEGSVDIFKKYPVFGVGRDNSSKYFLEYFEKNNKYKEFIEESSKNSLREIALAGNAHSMYFTVLGEQGLMIFGFVGMLLYLFLSQILFLFKCEKYSLIYYSTLAVIGVLAAFCVGGLTENNWQEFWKSSMFCASVGVYLGMKKIILERETIE